MSGTRDGGAGRVAAGAVRLAGSVSAAVWLAWVMVVAGCDPLPVDDAPPLLTSVGPVVGDGDSVALRFSVDDADGDPVELFLSWCRAEQSCVGHGCPGVTALIGTSNPLRVASTPPGVHSVRWRPACEPDPPEDTEIIVLCLHPTDGSAVQSPAFRLADLGVALEPSRCDSSPLGSGP